MHLGLVRICNVHFLHIADMVADDGAICLEKFCHLRLTQPGIVALEIYINLGHAIFSLINNQFGILLAHNLPST